MPSQAGTGLACDAAPCQAMPCQATPSRACVAYPGLARTSRARPRLRFHAMPLSGNSQDLEQAVAKTSTSF